MCSLEAWGDDDGEDGEGDGDGDDDGDGRPPRCLDAANMMNVSE